jgi:hypothetical protein
MMMRNERVRRVLVALALPALVLACRHAVPAGACAIDGVPSLLANGARAVLNETPRTRQNSAHWTLFVFTRTFAANQSIRFSEDLRELARTLPPEIVHGRWIWRWGDGGQAGGQTVVHHYARPGSYVVTVAVAVPHRAPFLFDAALVQVTR